MANKTQLRVEAINNGTVIDHIPANIGIKVLKLFQMDKSAERVTVGLNLPSSALGAKARGAVRRRRLRRRRFRFRLRLRFVRR